MERKAWRKKVRCGGEVQTPRARGVGVREGDRSEMDWAEAYEPWSLAGVVRARCGVRMGWAARC